MNITNQPLLLHLDMQSSSQNMSLNTEVPRQVLTIIGYRIEFTDLAAAEAAQMFFLSLPCNSSNQLCDNEPFIYVPLAVGGGSKIYTAVGLNIPLVMSVDLQRFFTAKVYNLAGLPLSNLVRLNIFMRGEYSY
jgi:hypothetical protein